MERYRFTTEQQTLLESMPQPLAVYQFLDRKVVTVVLSDGFLRLFGYEDRALACNDMDHNMYKDTHPDDVARISNEALRFATEGGQYEVFYRSKAVESGGYNMIHATGRHVYTEDGVRLAYVWYTDEGLYREDASGESFTQIVCHAIQEESIRKVNQYDQLAGLPTMTHFFELAEAAQDAYISEDKVPVFLYMNLSGMKYYNSRNGFTEGNKLLQAFSGLLAETFGSENCCRIGADHFAAFSCEDSLEDTLNGFLQKAGKLNRGNTLPVHVGIYSNQMGTVAVSTACDRAKLACDILKNSFSSCFRYYDHELKDDVIQRQYILSNLDRAINEGWIAVYYQPIVRSVNGKVCDEEALARWIDPDRGLLSPADFIPQLEDAGLIYKLDLHVLECVLAKMKLQREAGLHLVPVSINLSRSDFDACDIVEEIRRRVDASGLERHMITVEITESTIGRDFDFMKAQILRFQKLGFPVWMDDFGSGYSSLDVLQSIKFNLLKFDMSFMRRLNEGEDGRIILTELTKLATSLGMDTVCEGVETEEQVKFLQEIGCAKLQGYCFSKPIPYEEILNRYREGRQIGFENPEETAYYEVIGRVNLYDLAVIASEDTGVFQNFFNTLPMGIMEIKDGKVRFIRSNQSYRDFMMRFFGYDLTEEQDYTATPFGAGSAFMDLVRSCCATGGRSFFDEQMPDGSIVHSFARKLSVNPVTGTAAAAIAVLSITDPNEGATYANIARALAADYYNIYYVDLDTDRFIEYTSPVGGEELAVERHGENFFAESKAETMTRIYEEDRESFLAGFSKEKIIEELDRQGVYTTTYRLIESGEPLYAAMKITRMQGGNKIILGISIIDSQMKQQEEEKRLRREQLALGRIAALSPDYIVLYTVDLESGHYMQYNASDEFASFGLARQGVDFFSDVLEDIPKAFAAEDQMRAMHLLTRDNILREIQENGSFVLNYRLMINGKPVPVSLRAALVRENGRDKIIIGVTNDEEEYRRKLEKAYKQASSQAVVYNHIAHALARGYTDLYYVNMETNELIEFHTDDEHGVLSEVRRSDDFFEGCERDARIGVYAEDQEAFIRAMNREFLQKELADKQVFELAYRRVKKGRPFYVLMRVTRMEDDERILVIDVRDVDEQVRHRMEEERIQEERVIYARLHALTGNSICVYVVDPDTGSYREFSSAGNYEDSFAQAKSGADFFPTLREAAGVYAHPDDRERVLSLLTQENVMREVKDGGVFTLGYRIMTNGTPVHYQLKAAMAAEKEGLRLIVGLNDIEAEVRREEEYANLLAHAEQEANIDILTGVKNRHAWQSAVTEMNLKIAEHGQPPFAIVMCDVNDLKSVNDTFGHQRGDQYLKAACKIICDIYKRSPVFRFGGDEFAVILQGEDYRNREDLLARFKAHNEDAVLNGGITLACGMAVFDGDSSVAEVFSRADQNMYAQKTGFKEHSDQMMPEEAQ